ncbi:MAG: hypothetical protein EHM35_11865, partial [Planctomycetaceae bacterium]
NYGSADETITLTDGGSGRIEVASTSGATVTLNNPSSSLTIDAGGGDDTVNLDSLGSGFTADLMIEGNTGYDTLAVGPQGAPVGLVTGGITIPGFPPVSYGTTVEAVTIDEDVVVSTDATLNAREYNLRSLIVTNGSVLTLASDSSATGFQGVRITTSYDLTIDAGSAISGDGQGYAGSQGPGAGATASSGGTYYGGGGGYGEQGGNGDGGAQGGATYGSATEPTDLGSGGGYEGGEGGGAIRLVVNGTLLLDGGIVCGGAPGGYHAGGGSGGSIYLTVGTLAGAGMISADGGAGGEGGGGGGGGRIAIYYGTDTFSGTVTASGGAGFSPGGTGSIFYLHTGVPSAPAILAIATDTGTAADAITSDKTLIISGTAEANNTVRVFVNGSSVGTTVADDTGVWSFDHTGTPLNDGVYSLTATATNQAGHTSALSPVLTLVVDTEAPATPVIGGVADDTGTPGDGITSDNRLIVSGTVEANCGVDVFLNGGFIGMMTANASGAWAFDYTDSSLGDGSYEFTATVTDPAGNTSTASSGFSVLVDTAAPTVAVNSLTTTDTTPQLAGAVNDPMAVVEIVVDSGTYIATNNHNGTWTLADDAISPALAVGTYNVIATATDAAGNAGTDGTLGELTIQAAPSEPIAVDDLVSVSLGSPRYNLAAQQTSVQMTITNTSSTALG